LQVEKETRETMSRKQDKPLPEFANEIRLIRRKFYEVRDKLLLVNPDLPIEIRLVLSEVGHELGDLFLKMRDIGEYPPEHEESASCWCKPRLDYEDPASGNRHYVHNSIDEIKDKGLEN
jgi:hypothetical protein